MRSDNSFGQLIKRLSRHSKFTGQKLVSPAAGGQVVTGQSCCYCSLCRACHTCKCYWTFSLGRVCALIMLQACDDEHSTLGPATNSGCGRRPFCDNVSYKRMPYNQQTCCRYFMQKLPAITTIAKSPSIPYLAFSLFYLYLSTPVFGPAPAVWHIMKLNLADSRKSRTIVRISNLLLTLLESTSVCYSCQAKREFIAKKIYKRICEHSAQLTGLIVKQKNI